MIRPLNFEELVNLLAGPTFRFFNNANWMFFIGEVLLQLEQLVVHSSNRVFEAAAEL
jgi:hypothetical protein